MTGNTLGITLKSDKIRGLTRLKQDQQGQQLAKFVASGFCSDGVSGFVPFRLFRLSVLDGFHRCIGDFGRSSKCDGPAGGEFRTDFCRILFAGQREPEIENQAAGGKDDRKLSIPKFGAVAQLVRAGDS
jgi:hypothetical protein